MPRIRHLAPWTCGLVIGLALCGAPRPSRAATPVGGDPDAPRSPESALEKPSDPYVAVQSFTTGPSARPLFGGTTSIQVNVAANGSNILGDAANEPSLAVDPTNPNHMAIGWRQFDTVASNFRQAGWGYSTDGGRTWHFPGVLTPGEFRSDPVLGFDATGIFQYMNIKVVGSDYTVHLFKSTNGGMTWGPPVYAFGGDKEWFITDRTAGIGRGHIYESWSTSGSCCGTNTLTRSTNGGTSFPQALGIPGNPLWGTMEVAPDGALYVAGVDLNDMSHIFVARSSNAQNRLALPTFESIHDVDLNGAISSFEPSSPNPGGLLGQVWIAADRSSGPSAGWIYVVASVDPPGADPLDVMFSRSTDRGVTWSAPLRLNDDAGNNWQWFATLAVAPNGRIDVVWNDSRNTGQPNLSQLFSSSSSDGGTTWTPDAARSPVWNSWVGWPNQDKIGDYYQMISDDVGANLAWSATFNNEQDVWFMRLGEYDCNANGVGDSTEIASGAATDWNYDGIPDACQDLQVSDAAPAPAPTRWRLVGNIPNPFNPSTSIAFEAPAAGTEVKLRIYDIAGRLVRALASRTVVGRNVVSWDGRDEAGSGLGSGVYVARLEAPGFSAARRLVLIR